MRPIWMCLAGGAVAFLLPTLASAQRVSPKYSSQSNAAYRAVYGRPTVSPYLNLLRPQNGVGAPNYQSLVRPQLDQERLNQMQERQIQGLQNRLYADTPGRSQGTPNEIRSTGHVTRYMNYSAYYPALNGPNGGQQQQQRRIPGGGR